MTIAALIMQKHICQLDLRLHDVPVIIGYAYLTAILPCSIAAHETLLAESIPFCTARSKTNRGNASLLHMCI